MSVYPKIIEIPENFVNIPKLTDILTSGMLITSTQMFYRYMRVGITGSSADRYLFSLKELSIMSKTGICPALMYVGTVPNSFFLDHKFLIGTKFCFMYEDDFQVCLPLTLTILNSNS